ncbi:glycosyltransferase family 2 protein [Bacillus alkalicola]|uniref:Glycosyltransferase family 2 protein n=2 Tax=Bacillales TaxID=1385 RepID=A0ABS6JZT2_9BACI|nr:glycosyltransferase family 2 protein [Bacillus alkalicola]
MMKVDVIIPAYNEEKRIGKTLSTLNGEDWVNNILVVDDGSIDRTFQIAQGLTDQVLKLPKNKGKGAAVMSGLSRVSGEWIMLLDADLGSSVKEAKKLMEPVQSGKADLAIAALPEQSKKGFGLVKKRAQDIVLRETGVVLESPLSGQRMFHKKWIPTILSQQSFGFGLELQLNLTFLKNGGKIEEVETEMYHRATGKNLRGFYHRAKQWFELERTLWNF